MRPKIQSTVILILVAILTSVTACADDSDKAEQIDELMSKYHELRQFNGAVLVAEDGKVLYQGGYGLANMEWDIPNTPDTKFRIGSITKQFTAMLILQQVEEGTLSLDATLFEMLPYYREDTGSQITLHQLLNHTSGIPSYTSLPGFMGETSRLSYDPETFVREFCSGDLEFEPGSEFRYNNSGYFLLGAILERATGKSYEDLLQEKIFEPVGMHTSGYDISAEILPYRAAGHVKTPQGFRNAEFLDMSLPYAAGSIYSTVGDLYLWDRALHGGELLSKALSKTMFTPGMENYAYGWFAIQMPIGPDDSEIEVVSHGGGINGFNTLIKRVTEDEHLVVLLNNTGRMPLQSISTGILDILYERMPVEPRQPPSELIAMTAATSGVEAAIAMYRELAESEPTAIENAEALLNQQGYLQMSVDDLKSALAVFRLNAELFPESGNVHDSLGEALAKAGRTEDAIKSYARSLELDPGNRNAERQISNLSAPRE